MRLVVKCDLSAQFNGQSGTSRESSKQGMAVPKEIVYMGKLATFNIYRVWVFFSLLIVLQNFCHYLCQMSP